MKKRQIVSPVQYYNEIAHVYNNHLSTAKDENVRAEVADYFTSVVSKGKVLDFGGGTGLDLPWLVEANYQVYFCEPADKMREQAEQLSQSFPLDSQPIFLRSVETNFERWDSQPPFGEKLEGVLANFGVVNYVSNLENLFRVLSGLLKPEGLVVINLLYASPSKLFTRYLKNTVKAVLYGRKIKSSSTYNDVAHETTLYSVKNIRDASKLFFDMQDVKVLGGGSDFLMISLKKRTC